MAGHGGKKQFQFFAWRKVEIRYPLATVVPVNPRRWAMGPWTGWASTAYMSTPPW